MSNIWIIIPFSIGTLAFFATLYITIFVPKMSDTPWDVEQGDDIHLLRQWDTVITWLMWGGWGIAMLMQFLAKNKYLDQLEGLFG